MCLLFTLCYFTVAEGSTTEQYSLQGRIAVCFATAPLRFAACDRPSLPTISKQTPLAEEPILDPAEVTGAVHLTACLGSLYACLGEPICMPGRAYMHAWASLYACLGELICMPGRAYMHAWASLYACLGEPICQPPARSGFETSRARC